MYAVCIGWLAIPLFCLFTAERPPKVDQDAVPRELIVKAGKNAEVAIPYTGKLTFSN